jgi:hypothetical protein
MRLPPKPKRLFAPVDATETRRQGQGIGDLEAMRQMATTAIPEVLRNAPLTSTPMGVYDTGKAALEGDKLGVALGLASMVPLGKVASRVARALPMDEASRMARAAEMGYTTPVYHGTSADFGLRNAFKMKGGNVFHEIPSAHVGTDVAASQRVMALEGLDEPPPLVRTDEGGARVMELLMKAEKPFYGFDTGPQGMPLAREGNIVTKRNPLNEHDIGQIAKAEYARKHGKLPDASVLGQKTEAVGLLRQRLLDEGYDVVPYINAFEDRGSTSYMVLKPENLRLKGAAFDPAKAKSGNLMANLALMLGGGAVAGTAMNRREQ